MSSEESFPYLDEHQSISFPSPLETEEDIVAVGGNLSPGMLLSAYRQGIFPWFSENEPIYWWSLDPRFVLYPGKLHISKSMKKILKKGIFHCTMDTDFEQVIRNCGSISRRDQRGTWITSEMIEAYKELHRLGYAHSVEVWNSNGDLAGGLYGICLGEVFFGESMFARETNASKAGFINMVVFLREKGITLIDCQQETQHLKSLGAEAIPLESFIKQLKPLVHKPTLKGNWSVLFPVFSSFSRSYFC